MKKSILPFLCSLFLLAACTHKSESLIGTWVVNKVNVQFDENRTTPELVRQIGEMEKGNTFSINADSIMYFNGMDESFEGRISLSDGTKLYCGQSFFGEWKYSVIVTKTGSPLGEIVVTYSRK